MSITSDETYDRRRMLVAQRPPLVRAIAAGCLLLATGLVLGYAFEQPDASRVGLERPVTATLLAVPLDGAAVSFQTASDERQGVSEAMPVANLTGQPLRVGQEVTGYVVRVKTDDGYSRILIVKTATGR